MIENMYAINFLLLKLFYADARASLVPRIICTGNMDMFQIFCIGGKWCKCVTLVIETRRKSGYLFSHTCESPSTICLCMFYEIHDCKAEHARCLHHYTLQGIYSIWEIIRLALVTVKYSYYNQILVNT